MVYFAFMLEKMNHSGMLRHYTLQHAGITGKNKRMNHVFFPCNFPGVLYVIIAPLYPLLVTGAAGRGGPRGDMVTVTLCRKDASIACIGKGNSYHKQNKRLLFYLFE